MLTGNTVNFFISAFHIWKSRINFSKMLLVSGFFLLISIKVMGQPPCSNTKPVITFYDGHPVYSTSIDLCEPIGNGVDWQNDIDINSGSNGTYLWYYSTTGSDPWILIPYTGNQLVISSFYSTPGHYYFKLRVTNGCWVESDPIDLIVNNGTPPASPIGTGGSRCSTGSVTLSASCSGSNMNWYAAQFGGSSLGSGLTFNTPSISSTTTYYVSCTSGGCQSPRTAVVATIGEPSMPGTITGLTTVCPGQNNVSYSVPAVSGVTFIWDYSGSGATINGSTNSVTVNFSSSATSGILSVVTTGCGTSDPSTQVITVNPISAPTVSNITQPTCPLLTGGVLLSGLPNPWTLTRIPGGNTSGAGTSTTISGLAPNTTYNFTVTNSAGCISGLSNDVDIGPAPDSPTITGTLSVCVGFTTQLTGSGTPAAVNPWVLQRQVSNVNSSGLVTGVSAGTSVITYTG